MFVAATNEYRVTALGQRPILVAEQGCVVAVVAQRGQNVCVSLPNDYTETRQCHCH